MPGKAENEKEISCSQAARILQISVGTVQHLIEEGKLRAWRMRERGWWRIAYSSVQELLTQRSRQMGRPPVVRSSK